MPMLYFLLGAEDPEMHEIRKLISDHKDSRYSYAMLDRTRVSSGTAYQLKELPPTYPDETLVLVECGTTYPHKADKGQLVVDHHHESQPQANFPPTKFWEASSLGQVFNLLRGSDTPSIHLLTRAAMDHCLFAAYAGNCPGVNPETVFNYDLINLSQVPGGKNDINYVKQVINSTLIVVKSCPKITIGNQELFDTRGRFTPGVGYNLDGLVVTKTACKYSLAVIMLANDSNGRQKTTLGGICSPETVKTFMHEWAPKQGLVDIYGAPGRGYAGGYMKT